MANDAVKEQNNEVINFTLSQIRAFVKLHKPQKSRDKQGILQPLGKIPLAFPSRCAYNAGNPGQPIKG